MDHQGLRTGHLVALAGALATLVSLWLPWFELHLGAAGRAGFEQGLGRVPEPFAAFARGLLAQIDGLRLTGWRVFERADVALAVGAGLVVAVILAAAGSAGSAVRVEAGFAGRLAGGAGLLGGLLVLDRMVDRPGPSEVLALAPGGWVALAGCGLVAVGGALASGETRRPATAVFVPAVVPVVTGSVAPPAGPRSDS